VGENSIHDIVQQPYTQAGGCAPAEIEAVKPPETVLVMDDLFPEGAEPPGSKRCRRNGIKTAIRALTAAKRDMDI
jgi:hypothetical protein